MKKNQILMLLALGLCLFGLIGCQSKEEVIESEILEEETEEVLAEETDEVLEETEEVFIDPNEDKDLVNIGVMKGPTGIGALGLTEEADRNYAYDLVVKTAPDELVALLSQGDIDLAIIPSNLASILYNAGNLELKALASNNLGVLYVIERGESINSLEDLEGKEVLSPGKGTTPEMVVTSLFEEKGLAQDGLSFTKEAEEIVQSLVAGKVDIAVLPEPLATSALAKDESLRRALDLNDAWEDAFETSQITSVLVGTKEAVESLDGDKLVEDFAGSIDRVLASPETTGELSEEYDLFPKAIAVKALDKLNLKAMSGKELADHLNPYLEVLYNKNPESIGGSLPGDDFYW